MPRFNPSLCHDFFYAPPDGCGNGKARISYSGKTFYSYSTAVAQKETAKDGTKVVFISWSSMSATTGAHLSALRAAIPSDWKWFYFPFKKGKGFTLSMETIRLWYKDAFESISEKDLEKEVYRSEYTAFSHAYRECCTLFGWLKKDTRKTLAMLDRKDAVAAEIEEKRKKAEETRQAHADENRRTLPERKAKKLEALVAKFRRYGIAEMPVCDLARSILADSGRYDKVFSEILRAWMKSPSGRFDPASEKTAEESFRDFASSFTRKKDRYGWSFMPRQFSFVWPEDQMVRTSQNVTVSVNHVKAAFREFDALEDKKEFVCRTIHGWTVASVDEREFVIGCHRIPMENINDLRKQLFKEEQ